MMMNKPNYTRKTEPFPHQDDAIRFICNNKDVAIFDEQGLGKTKIIIDSLALEMESKRIDSVLVICKKTLMKNWEEEIEIHSHLNSVIIKESRVKRGNLFTVPAKFMIIGYETALSEVRTLKQLLKIRKMAVVLDESHKIKNINSKITQALHEISPLAKQRIILSGTPVANKPEDLWAQFFFLDMGELLGKNFAKFKETYGFRNNSSLDANKVTLYKKLTKEINKKSIRRLKKDVLELPDKIYKNVMVNLNNNQQEIYSRLRKELIVEITNMEEEQVLDENDNILKKLLRLTQVASNPGLINSKYNETPAKIKVLDSLIKEIVAKGEKAIIWSSFVGNIVSLKRRYREHQAVTVYGHMTIDERNDAISQFKKDPDCRILIANPAAAREGLTLTVANNAIYLDRNFNLVDYLQSQDRIHRISQTKKCNILHIIAENTVDEYIDEVIFDKNNVAGFIQGDITRIKAHKLKKDMIFNILEEKNGR